jgi:hypothetical protein
VKTNRLADRGENQQHKDSPEGTENMIEEPLYQTEQRYDDQWLNLEQMKIAKWLKGLRFRRKFFGGVSEQDVWKKISELNDMYKAALTAERIRYDALIEHYGKHGTATAHEEAAAGGE